MGTQFARGAGTALIMFLAAGVHAGRTCPFPAAQAQDAPPGADTAAPPPTPQGVLDGIERAAIACARAGRKADGAECVELLRQLGAADAAIQKLSDACDKAFAKATKPPAKSPSPAPVAVPAAIAAAATADALKALRKAATDLAATIPERDDAVRRAVSTDVLRIDATAESAHLALGHVRDLSGVAGPGGSTRWVRPEMPEILARRGAIESLVAQARKLPVECEVGPSDLDVLVAGAGAPGKRVSSCGYTFHSVVFSEAKMRRMLTTVIRTCALSAALRTGEVTLPRANVPMACVLLRNRDEYLRALAFSEKALTVDPKRHDHLSKLSSYQDSRANFVMADLFEGGVESAASLYAWDFAAGNPRDPQPTLLVGHLDWVFMTIFGQGFPHVSWTETVTNPSGRTSDQRQIEREEFVRLAAAGISGSRAYMRYLAARGEDPPWSRSFVDAEGKIQGEDLLKARHVAEYLHETGRFTKLFEDSASAPPGAESIRLFLDEELPTFEAKWRDWLLPLEDGLVQRIDTPPGADATPAERALLTYLDGIRARAVSAEGRDRIRPLGMDADLTLGCRAHAAYLAKHREQLSAWPDAHEEYPEKEGFSSQGARAGLSSVIAPGVARAQDAVDGWMGTFYHRLPLLDPGLMRIGFGMEGGTAVLDSGSMVAPTARSTWCAWPAENSVGVPRRFAPELPNPVPDADQSGWGYPITFQWFGEEVAPTITLELRKDDLVVPCHVSTPEAPSNPDLAPKGAYCLIPKATLEPNATYVVVASGLLRPTDKEGKGTGRFTWRFTTGK